QTTSSACSSVLSAASAEAHCRALPYPSVTVWADVPLPWRACLEEAWAAYRAGSLPIGAVVLDTSGHIVGRGRNRIFEVAAELPDSRCLFGHRLAHAEINALLGVDHAAVRIQECT